MGTTVDLLRVIKAVLGISIIVFTVAGAGVSFAIVDRQKALREVARYNMVWAVSQSTGGVLPFRAARRRLCRPG